jgi:hypothetical protein
MHRWSRMLAILPFALPLVGAPRPAAAGPNQIPPGQIDRVPAGIAAILAQESARLIAISETYVDALEVPGPADAVLLHPEVKRWTQQNYADPPRNDDVDELRASVAAEDLPGVITNRRWTVDPLRQETFMIADIVLDGLAKPIILYERFLISDGLIKEIEAIFYNPN